MLQIIIIKKMKISKPNNLGKILVEDCQKIRIEEFLKSCRNELKKHIISLELELSGYQVELTTSDTHYGGKRIWFKCPLCNNRVGVLFIHPLTQEVGCRNCLNLKYRKTRYKGMAEESLDNK